jgi:hypothetical protein
MNSNECSTTARISLPSPRFSSSTPVPEINEMYPSTSGSTQGERNEISPAKNAAAAKDRMS